MTGPPKRPDPKAEDEKPRLATRAVHAGEPPDPGTGASNVPIYLSAGFAFDDVDHAAALFAMEDPGYLYSRISNPTVSAFEERMAALEGGTAAVASASGMATLVMTITTLASAGDEVICAANVYGGTMTLLAHVLPRFGITAKFVDPRDPEAVDAAVGTRTRLVLAETLGNPGLDVLDIPAMADAAHESGLPLVVDNTFASPALCRPLEWGADIVVHSATKILSGLGSVIGGVLIDGGVFDWVASNRHPTMTEPYPPYGGLVFSERFGRSAFAGRARADVLQYLGAVMSPETAFRLIQSVASLPARVERAVRTAGALAGFLEGHRGVESVAYPGLPSHPDHKLARRLLPDGGGFMVSFEVQGGFEAGRSFVEVIDVFTHLASLGDARSLVVHPASTTHRRHSDEARAAAGISPGMIRMSVGQEDSEDLVEALSLALDEVAPPG